MSDNGQKSENGDKKDKQDPAELAKQFIQTWSQNLKDSVEKLFKDLKSDAGGIKRDGADLGRALVGKMMPLVLAARSTPRATRIATEAAMIFGSYRFLDVRTRTLSPEAVAIERKAVDQRAAERAVKAILEARGAMLKLGQFASTRRDLLPPVWIEALSRLQDQVPAIPFEGIVKRIDAELGPDRFATIDETPLAAASLAQVHAATLPDGTRVAIKVQVPGIEEVVEGDLALLSLIVTTLGDLAKGLDLDPIVREMTRSVREELDYKLEAERTRRMAQDLAGDTSVHVPAVHEDLSTARVLVLERIDGERLTDYLDRAVETGDRGAIDRILTALVRTYATQILALGRFQADPHPGNFLVEPGGRLALVDFGAIETLSAEERQGYAGLIAAMMARDRKGAGQVMALLGFQSSDPDQLYQMADLILDAFRPDADRPLAEINPREAFDQALALARSSQIRIPHHFVQLGRALAALTGLLLAYKPAIDLHALVAPHAAGG
jgi:ubiquinone biosynthesis protein